MYKRQEGTSQLDTSAVTGEPVPVRVYPGVEDVYKRQLKKLLKDAGFSTAVGDEGGFAPDFPDAKTALRWMKNAVEKAGYQTGQDICFALDVAATELYDQKFKKYVFEGEKTAQGEAVVRSAEELIDYYDCLLYTSLVSLLSAMLVGFVTLF